MIRASLTLLLTASLVQTPAYSAKPPPYVYGPQPDWEEYKRLGEAAVLAALPDAARWKVEWRSGYVQRGWAKASGWFSCGMLRPNAPDAKGRLRPSYFLTVIDYGEVKYTKIHARYNGPVDGACSYLIAHGMVPPVAMMEQPHEIVLGELGLTILPMPQGAYVTAVAPGSAAAKAGLLAGTVLTKVNDLTLAGLGQGMAKILSADTELRVETVTGARMQLR